MSWQTQFCLGKNLEWFETGGQCIACVAMVGLPSCVQVCCREPPCGFRICCCIASVHNWDRIGSLLRAMARRILQTILLRYVDDFFGPDPAESANNAMLVFERLVRAFVGVDAASPSNRECGNHSSFWVFPQQPRRMGQRLCVHRTKL